MIRSYLSQFSLLRMIYGNFVFFRHALREGIWTTLFNIENFFKDNSDAAFLTWKVLLPEEGNSEDLETWLLSKKIKFSQGSHTIYFPPQENLEDIIGEAKGFYPESAGFKILKDFSSPNKANYMGNHTGKGGGEKFRRLLSGTPSDQSVVANYMHYLDIGPRIYDICCFNNGIRSFTVL